MPTPTLAQLLGPDAAAVPALPTAPIYEVWLFENPVPPAIVLVILSVALLLILLRLGKRTPGLVVFGAGLLLAGGLIAAGQAVTTPREVLHAGSARLVEATAAADAASMTELLDLNASIRPSQIRYVPTVNGREAIIGAAETIPNYIERVVVLETRAGMEGPRVGRSQVRVRALGNDGQLLGHSWWALDWQQVEGEWRVVTIQPLWIQGQG